MSSYVRYLDWWFYEYIFCGMKPMFKYFWFFVEFENKSKTGRKDKNRFGIHTSRQEE